MKTDIELRDDVLDEPRWEPAVNAAEIGVAVKDGTEGWIAGLQMAALSLRQREARGVAQFIPLFSSANKTEETDFGRCPRRFALKCGFGLLKGT